MILNLISAQMAEEVYQSNATTHHKKHEKHIYSNTRKTVCIRNMRLIKNGRDGLGWRTWIFHHLQIMYEKACLTRLAQNTRKFKSQISDHKTHKNHKAPMQIIRLTRMHKKHETYKKWTGRAGLTHLDFSSNANTVQIS